VPEMQGCYSTGTLGGTDSGRRVKAQKEDSLSVWHTPGRPWTDCRAGAAAGGQVGNSQASQHDSQ